MPFHFKQDVYEQQNYHILDRMVEHETRILL